MSKVDEKEKESFIMNQELEDVRTKVSQVRVISHFIPFFCRETSLIFLVFLLENSS
jgi:hypothetical protein